jgi:ATP-dependent RNA helicase RhlE
MNPDLLSFVTEEDQHHFKIIQKKIGTWVTQINSDEIDI